LSDQSITTGKTRDGREFLVRKYQPGDRDRVRYICSETGFIGRPQEAVFEGREEFADLWSSYWTDREPQSAFVACVEGKVEGYLLGCVDTRVQERVWAKETLPAVGKKMLRYRWWSRPINRKYVRAMIRSYRRGEMKVDMAAIIRSYPAHLHTNIADPGLRGQGVGKAMMTAYFDFLRENNVPGVHLGTTSHNREAVPFYQHMGFEIIEKKRLTCYAHAIDDPPLFLLYMSRKISADG